MKKTEKQIVRERTIKRYRYEYDFHVQIACEKAGISESQIRKKLKIIEKKKYDYIDFIRNGWYATDDEMLHKLEEKEHKREPVHEYNALQICKEMGWAMERYHMEYEKAANLCGCDHREFYSYGIYRMNYEEARKYYTRRTFNRMYHRYCDFSGRGRQVFVSKLLFNQVFHKFVFRRWFVNRNLNLQQFEEQIQGLSKIIYKPEQGYAGIGIKAYEVNGSHRQNEAVFMDLMAMEEGLVEEWVTQHESLQTFWPCTLNTMRLITFRQGDMLKILCGIFRTGVNPNQPTDNVSQGGIAAAVDLDSGKICTDAIDYEGNIYHDHPETGQTFIGFQIPGWDKIIKLCEEAATVVASMPFIGWDIAVREDGRPELIEGNDCPDHVAMQMPYIVSGDKGLNDRIKPYIMVNAKDEVMRTITDITELREWVKQQEEIQIYGAGALSRRILKVLDHFELIQKVGAIYVTELNNKRGKYHYGIKIQQFNDAISDERNHKNVIMVAVSERYQIEVMEELEKVGISNYVLISEGLDYRLYQEEKDGTWKKEYEADLWEKLVCRHCQDESNNKKADILFLTPPYWDVFMPCSAAPVLTAKVKEEGFTAIQCEVGIYCMHNLLKKYWRDVADQCLSRWYYENNVELYEKNPYKSYEEYCDDLWFLRSSRYDFAAVKSQYQTFNPIQKQVIHYLYKTIIYRNQSYIDFNTCQNIERELQQYDTVNLLETLCQEELSYLFRDIPDVIGMSVSGTEQFLPACVLARLFKTLRPDVKIVWGGSSVELFVHGSDCSRAEIKQWFDYIILGEGETAIPALLRYLKGEISLENVPNLVHIVGNGDITLGQNTAFEDVNTLPMPDFEGVNWDLYMAPEIIIPYQSSRGCFYGQCAFCGRVESHRYHYRSKDAKKVVKEVRHLAQRYNAKHFSFIDEAIRTENFRELVDEMDIHREFKGIKWFYYSRVSRQYDEALLRKAHQNGCEMVILGIETFHQRLLNLIRKGITADTSRYCLELFHRCGIKTYIFMMCNLPSETLEEANEDILQLIELKEYIEGGQLALFSLYRHTAMYDEPEKYNIIAIDPKDPIMFQSHNNGIPVEKSKEDLMDLYNKIYMAKYINRYKPLQDRYGIFFGPPIEEV